ncbi:MAG TPA: hypothetical protein VEQ16_09260 [Acidocella sp.]|nr:hypothetical protein [Acidocella sp.]
MFSAAAGIRDYEFIYVSDSPEIARQLLKEAELCSMIYGLDLTLVILNSHAGCGGTHHPWRGRAAL